MTPTPRRRHGSSRSTRTASDLSLLACVCAGPRAGADLRVPRAWTVRAGTWTAVRCREGPSRSLRARHRRSRRYDRLAAIRPGGNAAVAMKSVVADPGRYDWEGDQPLRRPFAETDHLRTPRARLHAACELRRPARDERDVRRIDREDSLSQRPGRHRGRAVAGVSVRPSRCAARPGELLGVPARLLLRAASCVQFAEATARGP